jgi:hypothetical protein
MSQPARRLNSEGIARFKEHLERMRHDSSLPPPQELLTDNFLTEILPGGPCVEPRPLPTKRSAAEYLHQLFPSASNPRIETDMGLWSWLALYFFDQVCPPRAGRRTLRKDPHYILDATDHWRRYRHLLVTPYRILASMPDHNRIFLDGPLSVHGEIIEQTISKLYMFRLPGVRAAIDRLYFDEERGRPKPGIFPKKHRRGDLRNRFPARIRQLQMTYDVAAVDATQLIELLGSEFGHFAPAPAAHAPAAHAPTADAPA